MLEKLGNKIKSFMSKPAEEKYEMEKDIELIIASPDINFNNFSSFKLVSKKNSSLLIKLNIFS